MRGNHSAGVCLLVVCVGSTDTPTTQYEEGELIDVCGSPTFCVTLSSPGGGNIVIDGLHRSTEGVTALDAKVPEWFGPHPAQYVYGRHVLETDKSFEYYGMPPGAKVTMRQVPTRNSEL